MKKLVLIDSNALVHRAFHALPPSMSSSQGVMTNAIFGFMSVMIKMIKDLKPDYIAATFDLAGPTFRHEEFAEYKSHRIKAPDELYMQIPYIKEILAKFGIPVFEKAGFEADDVIGALAEQAKETKDLQVIIMTGDLDTLQLVEDEKVVVFTLRKGMTDTFIYNEKEVKARYDIGPSQMTDFKGLKGDPSDNIPGVPGIGDKTASVLIKKFGSLEKLYEGIAKIQSSKSKVKTKELSEKLIQKLADNKDQAFFSKRLATIIRDVDIEFNLQDSAWREHMDRPALEKILKDLALYNIVKRLGEIDPAGLAGAGGTIAPVIVPPPSLFDVAPIEGPIKAILTSSDKEIEKAFSAINKLGKFVLDVQLGFITLGYGDNETAGFPETVLTHGKLMTDFKKILEDNEIKKTGHDIKALVHWGLKRGILMAGFEFDTKLAAYLINSDIKDFSLERLFFAEFERDLDSEPLKRPIHIAVLKERYQEKLKKLGLDEIMNKMELPLSPILARMEEEGIKVDKKALKKLSVIVSKETAGLEKEISKLAGSEFNINSPRQLSTILFEKLELKGKVKKTGRGALSTAAGELEKLIDEHPIVALILKYRELQKLKTTYIEPFPALLDASGRVHTTYNQTGTTTGRLSSQDPNLQNIPTKTEVGQEFRKSFIADSGFELVSFDYSQVELRIAAHISGDKNMSEAFKRGEDIHTRTAAGVFRVKPEEVTKEMRRQAKVLNFGVLYGMGSTGFQRAAGVGRDEARAFIDNYMTEFSGFAKYIADTKVQAHKNGFVSTIFGRRRQLADINSGMTQLVASAERMAVNMPIQGTAADLLKLAMIEVQKLLDEKYSDSAKMLLQVHDELLFEVKKDIVPAITKEIKNIMETVHKFDVPIIVDAKAGDNWAEMK